MEVEAALRKRESDLVHSHEERERIQVKLIRAEKDLEEEKTTHERDLERQMTLIDGGAKRVQEELAICREESGKESEMALRRRRMLEEEVCRQPNLETLTL